MNSTLPSFVDAVLSNAFEAIYSLTPLAEKTVILVPTRLRENVVSYLAQTTGFDEPTIAFIMATLLCFPLAQIMYLLPYGRPKHLASFLFGAFVLQFTIGPEWLHLFLVSLATYAMLYVLSPRHGRVLVPIFLISYLSMAHIHRMYKSYMLWNLDFTTPLMIMTIKLYSLAFNSYDGHVLQQAKKNKNCTEVNRATQRCARFAVYQVPGLLEYLGYAFCFSTVLAGPAFEFKTYADACSGEILWYTDKNGNTVQGTLPSRTWPTLKPFLQSMVSLVLYIVGTPWFPFLDPIHPTSSTPVVLTENFLTRPFYQRYLYAYVSISFLTMRYFVPWKSAEASTNLWYGGFEGFDESGMAKGFDNSINIDIYHYELATSFREMTRSVNKKTARWLLRYVYARTDGSLVATYFLSAFWHGFYPGYYLYFLSSPLLTMCERLGEKKVSPYFQWGNYWRPLIWKVFNFVWLKLMLGYFGGPFFLLSLDWSLLWWSSYGYYGHIACFVFYIVASLLPMKKQKEL